MKMLIKVNFLLKMRTLNKVTIKGCSSFTELVLTEKDLQMIENNVILRGHKNNISSIRMLINKIQNKKEDFNTINLLKSELEKLPNLTHPRLLSYGTEPYEIARFGTKQFNNVKEFSELCKRINLFRMDHLGNYTGHKSYYLTGCLATLEQSIVQFATKFLKEKGFNLVSVPDILPKSVIESCGMQTTGERTQVYKLDSEMCLSGTSEMALAGLFANEVFAEADLPIKVASVSRCYRAETSGLNEEKGIYRVHQFSKVEMFSVCSATQSEEMLESFKDIEIELYRDLGLYFRLLEMPPSELGSPAYQKYDIEAWMPGKNMWGEISSCSNCTDYQAKRLNIRYRTNENEIKFAHTLNGTAAAIPRLLIAIVETNQIGKDIRIPDVLKPLTNVNEIARNKSFPEMKLVKSLTCTT